MWLDLGLEWQKLPKNTLLEALVWELQAIRSTQKIGEITLMKGIFTNTIIVCVCAGSDKWE